MASRERASSGGTRPTDHPTVDWAALADRWPRDVALLVFDLDGTLIDSLPEIGASVNALRRARGLTERTATEIRNGIGAGARVLLQRTMSDAFETGAELDRLYQELLTEYRVRCAEKPTPYPGVVEFLQVAEDRGRRLALLTNKPLEITGRTLDALGWTQRFDPVLAPENSPARKPDPAGLLAILSTLEVPAERAVFLGDSHNDFEAGQAAGVLTLGYSGGYHAPGTGDPDLWFDDYARLAAITKQ